MEPPYIALLSKANQDFGVAHKFGDNQLLLGVFDGHGSTGGQYVSKLAAIAVAQLAARRGRRNDARGATHGCR